MVLTHLGSACAQPDVTILHLGGGISSCRGTQRYVCTSLKEEPWQGPPSLHSCFCLHSLTALVSHCWNWPFGTHGRCRRLRPFSYKQEMGDTERFLCLGGPHRVLLGFRGAVCWQYVWSSLLDRACKASYWQPQWGDKYYSYKLSRWDVGACWFPRDVEDEQWTLMGCPTEDGRPLEVACVPLADPPGLMLLLEATLSSNPPSSFLIPPFPLIPRTFLLYQGRKKFPLYSTHPSPNHCYLSMRSHIPWSGKLTLLHHPP